jgi:hypothetical protein
VTGGDTHDVTQVLAFVDAIPTMLAGAAGPVTGRAIGNQRSSSG